MNRCMIFLTLVIGTIHSMPRVVAEENTRGVDLPLYYDVRTGNVTVDATEVNGGVFTGYGLRIPFDGFLIENWTPFMNTFFADGTSRGFGESSFSGVSPGVYSLGNVISAGLSEEELYTYFGPQGPFNRPTTPFQYYAAGVVGGATYHHFSPQYVPSPFPTINDPAIGPQDFNGWATEIALAYDPGTGELVLDATRENGGYFMLYSVSLTDDRFDTDAFTPITDISVNSQVNELSEMSFEPIPGGYYSLGNVLPTGLNEDELRSLIETAVFLGQPARGSSPLDINAYGTEMLLTIAPTFLDSELDFDADGDVDVADVDILVAEIIGGTHDSKFDLSADGDVNNADLTKWLSDAASVNGFAESFLLGDVNLDGTVNVADVNTVAQNWLGHPNTWQLGDFNADGIVNTGDLNKIALNWQVTISLATSSEAVPEPTVFTVSLLGIMTITLARRRRGCYGGV